jgi:hypothetical protein
VEKCLYACSGVLRRGASLDRRIAGAFSADAPPLYVYGTAKIANDILEVRNRSAKKEINVAQLEAMPGPEHSPLPAYLNLLRIVFAVSIALGPLAFLLYGLFEPAGTTGRVIIAANAAEDSTLNQFHLAFGVLASFLLPFGYLGMSLLAMRRTPWLGTISLLLSLPSWSPLSALIGLDALTFDMAQMGGSASFAALWDHFNRDGVMFSYLLIYAACHLICTVLLGIALGRAHIIPLWAASALVVSSPLTIIAFPIHIPLYRFVLLVLVLILIFIGSIPAALAMLKTSYEEMALLHIRR